jgi:hypothetical protein
MAHSAQVSVSSVLKFTAHEQKRKKKKVSDNSEYQFLYPPEIFGK